MPNKVPASKSMPKTNFVEARTFWHLYRSFDRMWIFFIMAFQVAWLCVSVIIILPFSENLIVFLNLWLLGYGNCCMDF